MKKAACIVAAIIVLVAAGLSASAQNDPKRALAEELLNLLNVKETQQKALTMFQQMIVSQIQRINPPTKDPAVQAKMANFIKKIMDVMRDGMSWDKMKDQYITLYAETYTEPELKDIIAFYKTPSGKAFIKKQPEILKRSFELSQKIMTGLMPKIQTMTQQFEKEMKPPQPPAPPKPEAK